MYVIKVALKSWFKIESNIFNNYKDALIGFVVLICIPLLSIVLTINAVHINFFDYVFPLVSISLAELYDIYGRYHGSEGKIAKLRIRISFNVIAILFMILTLFTKIRWMAYIAPIALFVCGFIIVHEIVCRVTYAVKISKWYAKLTSRRGRG